MAWFPDGRDLAALAAGLSGTIATVEESDWSLEWRRSVRAVRVGPFYVTPPWLVGEAPPGVETIVIEPEMAFGTGDHPTTRGCLALLARAVAPGARVLDFGCGSGVLAVAAARLGAGSVVAVDCDPTAVAIAEKNATVNRIRLTAIAADRPPAGTFDVVVANIQSSVLEKLLPELRARLAPGGTLVLSGLLAAEEFEVEGPRARIVEGEWMTLEVGAP